MSHFTQAPNLKILNISDCDRITNEFLRAFVETAKEGQDIKLEVLNISKCIVWSLPLSSLLYCFSLFPSFILDCPQPFLKPLNTESHPPTPARDRRRNLRNFPKMSQIGGSQCLRLRPTYGSILDLPCRSFFGVSGFECQFL